MRLSLLSALLLMGALSAQSASAAQKPEPLYAIAVRLDRAAIWVGDALEYTIEVVHSRSIQFALDSLKKENLALSPFVVRDIRIEERPWRDDKQILEIVLRLTTYETGRSELQIPPLALYYFKREAGMSGKEARAQPIKVPPQRVALRSTLPPGSLRLREFKAMEPVNPNRAVAALALGLLGVGSIGCYAALSTWRAVRRPRPVNRPASRRARARRARESLERIRSMAHHSAEDMEAIYAESGRFLRDYLKEWLHVEARGLTPAEAEEALRKAELNGAFAEQVRVVLEQCEDGRYRKAASGPPDEGRYRSLVEALDRAIRMAPKAR